jgi:hypothetical protein
VVTERQPWRIAVILAQVSAARDFAVVQEPYGNVKTQFARAQFILWRVDAE